MIMIMMMKMEIITINHNLLKLITIKNAMLSNKKIINIVTTTKILLVTLVITSFGNSFMN